MKLTKISKPLKPFIISKLKSMALIPVAVLLIAPFAYAQGSPFDNGFTALQTLFTGTIAKVAQIEILGQNESFHFMRRLKEAIRLTGCAEIVFTVSSFLVPSVRLNPTKAIFDYHRGSVGKPQRWKKSACFFGLASRCSMVRRRFGDSGSS